MKVLQGFSFVSLFCVLAVLSIPMMSPAEIVIEYSGTARVAQEPVDITAADIDLDGDLDLITANEGGRAFTVLHNDGTGTFGQPRYVTITAQHSNPISVAVADFNADGRPDVAVGAMGELDPLNLHYTENTSLVVYTNQPDGSFTEKSYVIFGIPGSLRAVDRDEDGDIDIIVGNIGHLILDELSLVLEYAGFNLFDNQGDGTFVEAGLDYIETSGSVSPFEFADVNSDGLMDIVAVNQGEYSLFIGDFINYNITVLIDNGGGKLVPTHSLSCTSLPFRVTTGDFDGDGDIDIAGTEWGSASPEGMDSMNAGIGYWWNNGDGTFSEEQYVLVRGVPSGIKAVDLDEDGDLDLVVTNEGVDVSGGELYNPALMVFENDGAGNFTEVAVLSAGEYPRTIVLGDWDGNGAVDIAVAAEANNTVTTYLNKTPGTRVTDWTIY